MLDKIKDKTNEIVKKIINMDDSHEFKPVLSEIEDSPVSPLGRYTFWVIVAIMVVTVLWLTLGKVDIVVRPEDIYLLDEGKGQVNGKIISSIFKGVHYEMVMLVGKSEIVIQDTIERKVGENVSLFIKASDIHIMAKEFCKNAL